MGPEEPWSGTERPLGLLASIRHFGATIVALIQTRAELLATEFEEEVQRGFVIFLWMMLAWGARGPGDHQVHGALIFATVGTWRSPTCKGVPTYKDCKFSGLR
jgi:hypothetical protein